MNPTLQLLVGDAEAFLREHWHHEPVHRQAELPRLLSESEILDTVDCGLLVEPYFTVLPGEGRAPVPDVTITRRILNITKPGFVHRGHVRAALADGAALQLNQLEQWNPEVRELVAGLSPAFDTEVRAFAVLAGSDVVTTTAHTEGAHLLVLQLSGEAEWAISGAVEEKFLLRAGDVLYVPAGSTHRATAKGGSSVHLALAVDEPTTQDITDSLARELRRRFKAHERYRTHHHLAAGDKAAWVRTAVAEYCAKFAAATAPKP